MRLHHFNLIGVLLLTCLCVGQWLHDRELNLEINRLQREEQEQTSQLAKKDALIRGLEADISEFKERIVRSDTGLADARQKLRAAERQLQQLRLEHGQLASSITNWAAAVKVRDEQLKQAQANSQQLADALNSSITRFNTLATNHNALVHELNALREPAAKPQR